MLSMLGSSQSPDPLALWEELGAGVPTLMAFARLCSEALAGNRQQPVEDLNEEARAILYVARQRGSIEVKGTDTAVDSSERLLAICVEVEPDRQFVFRRRGDPQLTVRCLEGFRQLCSSGLVMHHLFREFSLTHTGFEMAKTIKREDVGVLAILAEDQEIDDY